MEKKFIYKIEGPLSFNTEKPLNDISYKLEQKYEYLKKLEKGQCICKWKEYQTKRVLEKEYWFMQEITDTEQH